MPAARNTNIVPWLIGGGIIAAVFYMRRRSTKAAYMLGIRVRIGGVKMVQQANVVQVELKVQNPNNAPVTVRSIVGDLFINNERLGNVFKAGDQLVAANSESSLYFEVRPKALSIFNTVSRLNLEKMQLLFRFVGTINMNGKAVPMNIVYRYQVLPPGTADNFLNMIKQLTGKK